MEQLRVLSGAMAGELIAVEEELVLGREQDGVGQLGGDTELSRRHARIERTETGHLLIEDLGSTNGTRVNGKLITEPQALQSGDQIEVGATKLQLVADPNATSVRGAPGAGETRVVAASPTPEAAAPLPAPEARASATPPNFTAHPAVDSSRSRKRRLFVGAGILLVLVAVALVVVLAVGGGDDSSSTGVAATNDCGANLGGGETVGYVTYVESNVPEPDANSVIAMPYRAGDMQPLAPSQCSTGGAGSADLTDSGVLDADNQVLINPDHTLLFAVNQGSDSIAVFQVHPDGSLQAAPGSPFPSGGMGPASVGLSGDTLVVANKAQDGVRDLSSVAPNYTSFKVAGDGQLTQVSGSSIAAKPGSSPTDMYVPKEGGVAFGTEESGPLRGFSIGDDGVLTQAANSPLDPDPAIFGSGFNPDKVFALGIAALPKAHGVYIGMPTVPAVAVYTYDEAGALRYINSVPVRGAYLPCWIVITPDGRWMYVVNAATNNVVAFDVGTNPAVPRQIQTVGFDQPGNPWNATIDPSGRFLFVNAPRDTLGVPVGEGNIQHVLQIGSDGELTEVDSSPADIPVPDGVNPQGIAVLPISG